MKSKITLSTTAVLDSVLRLFTTTRLELDSKSKTTTRYGIIGFFIARIKWIFLSPDQKKFTWDQFPAHFKGKSTKRGRSGALKSKLYWKWTISIIYISWIVYVLVWIPQKLRSQEIPRPGCIPRPGDILSTTQQWLSGQQLVSSRSLWAPRSLSHLCEYLIYRWVVENCPTWSPTRQSGPQLPWSRWKNLGFQPPLVLTRCTSPGPCPGTAAPFPGFCQCRAPFQALFPGKALSPAGVEVVVVGAHGPPSPLKNKQFSFESFLYKTYLGKAIFI